MSPDFALDPPLYEYEDGYYDPNAGAVVTDDTTVDYDAYLPDYSPPEEGDNWFEN